MLELLFSVLRQPFLLFVVESIFPRDECKPARKQKIERYTTEIHKGRSINISGA